LCGWPVCEVADHMVEAPLPAEGPGDDFEGKRAIAFVRELGAGLRERGGEVQAVRGHCA